MATKSKNSARARSYIGTWNNPSFAPEYFLQLCQNHGASCAIVQLEDGGDGVPHFQFYVSWKQPKAFSAVRSMCAGRAHLEVPTNIYKAMNYCRKQATRIDGPYSYGEEITGPTGQKRKASLLADVSRSPDRMRIEEPDTWVMYINEVKKEEFISGYIRINLDRPWQRRLTSYLSGVPDTRTIYWVYGVLGNEGKTTYAKHLCADGWFYSRGGSVGNVMYNYVFGGSTRHVVIDYSRETKEYVQYKMLEDLKDRWIESTKYRPIGYHELDPIHVVVMANFMYDQDKLSADRIVLIDCNDE